MNKYFCHTPGCELSLRKKEFPVQMNCPLCDFPLVRETFYNETEQRIIDTFPYVIAYPFQHMVDEIHGRNKLELLSYTFLNVLKYFALIIASEYFHSPVKSATVNEFFRDNLYQPSFGNWNQFIREVIKELDRQGYSWTFQEIKTSYEKVQSGKKVKRYKTESEYTNEDGVLVKVANGLTAIDALINFRNKHLGHGVPIDEYQCKILFERYYPILIDLFTGLKLFSELAMFKGEPSGVWSLMGHEVTSVNHVKKPGNLTEGQLWLQSNDGRVLNLLPFYVLPGQFTANTSSKSQVLIYEKNNGSRITFFSPERSQVETAGEVLESLKILFEEKEKEPELGLKDLSRDLLDRKCCTYNKSILGTLFKEKKMFEGIYQSRNEAEAALRGWVGAQSNLFLIAAQAGSGKTNLLGHISKYYEENSITCLLLRASRLQAGDLQTEMNRILNLDSKLGLGDILKLYSQSDPLIILIDGGNEHNCPELFLDSCVRLLEANKGGALKLVLSWRVSLLSELPDIVLDREILFSAGENKEQENPMAANALILTPYDKNELEGAWDLYGSDRSRFYKPKFNLEELTYSDRPLTEQLQNPLQLRLFLSLFNNKSLKEKPAGFTNIWRLWWNKIEKNEKEALFLSELAILLVEEQELQIPLDKLYDHPVLGEFVRYVQIDSPYWQLKHKGELSEFFKGGIVYVSFTSEAAMSYVLSRYSAKLVKDSEAVVSCIIKNKRWREPLRYLLWDQVQAGDMKLLISLIDDPRIDLDLTTIPLAQSIIIHGAEDIVKLLLAESTNRDWAAINRVLHYLEQNEYPVIINEISSVVIDHIDFNSNIAQIVAGRACAYLKDKNRAIRIANELLQKVEYENGILKDYKELDKISKISSVFGKYDLFDQYKKCINDCVAFERKEYGEKSGLLANSYETLGLINLRLAEYDTALEYFLKCKAIRLEILQRGNVLLIQILHNIALVYQYLQDNKKSIEMYEEVLNLETKFNGRTTASSATTLCNMGHLYLAEGNIEKSEELFIESYKIRKLLNNRSSIDISESIRSLSHVEFLKGNIDSAIDLLNEAIELNITLLGGDNSLLGKSYIDLSDLYMAKENYSEALKYLNKSLEIYNRNKFSNNIILSLIYYNFGECYKKLLDYDNAIYYLSLGFKVNQEGGYPFMIGQCYEALKEKHNALSNYITSAEIREQRFGLKDERTQITINEVIRLASELNEKDILMAWQGKLVKQ